jgi:hypothetical protein
LNDSNTNASRSSTARIVSDVPKCLFNHRDPKHCCPSDAVDGFQFCRDHWPRNPEPWWKDIGPVERDRLIAEAVKKLELKRKSGRAESKSEATRG